MWHDEDTYLWRALGAEQLDFWTNELDVKQQTDKQ